MGQKLACFLFIVLCYFFQVNASTQNLADESLSVAKTNDESLVFVILTHISSPQHETLYKKCYQSVREFYPDTPIVIIDDNSTSPLSDGELTNTMIIRSEYPGAGELLPYYYFVNCKWADKMVFLHDSMFLKRAFSEDELKEPIKFHWHFVDGRKDNLRLTDLFLGKLPYGPELIEFNKTLNWYGCFGVTAIIHLKVLEQIEEKYQFTHIFKDMIHTRKQRMALERVFGVLAFKENLLKIENCSNYGTIHKYPHNFRKINDDQMNEVLETYPGAIIKSWFGR